MYIPKHFEGTEAQGREIMQSHGWALLTTADADGAPITTASVTAGHSSRTFSTSPGKMFTPPRMIMSFTRPLR